MKTQSVSDVKREVSPDEEIMDLRDRIKTLNSRITNLKRDYGTLKSFFHDVADCIEVFEPQNMLYKWQGKPKKVSTPIVAVMQSSDIHMGSVQDADEIEDFNAFSPEICIDRCMKFSNDVMKWVELHRSNYYVDDLVHIVTGDLISGDIHENLRITNAFPTPVQVVKAADLLANMISIEAPHFKKLTVEFVVEDNHGRLTKLPQTKEAGFNSLNYLVGFIAKQKLANHENVEFNIYPQLQKVVEVLNRKYLITHGHKVRGWAGFPWYGIERKVGRESIKRMMADKNKFDKVVAGHFHTPLAHPWFWLSGSVQGTDAYDHGEGRYSVPSQPAWMVHQKYGEFNRTDFNLL